MNVELLRRVQKAILKEPKRVDMGQWIRTNLFGPKPGAGFPECGTVGCIFGWAETLAKFKSLRIQPGTIYKRAQGVREEVCHLTHPEIASRGARLLDVTIDQAGGLFLGFLANNFRWGNWPEDLRDRLDEYEPGTEEYAQVVSDAIDRFIQNPEEFTQ